MGAGGARAPACPPFPPPNPSKHVSLDNSPDLSKRL